MPLSPQITITPEDITTKNFAISAVTYTSTTATYTATGHTFALSDTVLVSNLSPDGYNGTFTITAVATNTFTVSNTTNTALTTATGNAFWVDPTEYSYENLGVVFLTDTDDLANPAVNPALSQAQAAQATATTALANASTAYSAAVASLQPSANTIVNASNQMTAIAANGITVYSGSSSSSGARVVMNSAGLAGYNSSGSATFSITASTGAAVFSGSVTGATITGSTMNIGGNAIIDSSGFLTATGATITGVITATSGSFTGSLYSSAGTIGGWNITSGQLYTGTLGSPNQYLSSSGGGLLTGAYTISSVATVTTLTVGSTATITSTLNANGSLYNSGHGTTASAANARLDSATGLLARSTASSQRYKEDIVNLVDVAELDPRKLYSLPVRAFRFRQGYIPDTDDRAGMLVPGFIAEELDAIYPVGADYVAGQVETWNDRMIVPAMMALIQEQNIRLLALEGK